MMLSKVLQHTTKSGTCVSCTDIDNDDDDINKDNIKLYSGSMLLDTFKPRFSVRSDAVMK